MGRRFLIVIQQIDRDRLIGDLGQIEHNPNPVVGRGPLAIKEQDIAHGWVPPLCLV